MPGILGGGTTQPTQPNALQRFFTPQRTLAFQGLGDVLRGGTGDKYLQGLISLQQQQAGQKLWDETFGRGAAAPAGAQAAPAGGFLASAMGTSPVTPVAQGAPLTPIAGTGQALAENQIRQGLIARGISPTAAEGFVINFRDESNLDPTITEAEPLVPGSRGGFGLAQWTGPRRVALEQFAQQTGRPVGDIDTQLDFLARELQGPESAAARSIAAAQTPQEAAVAVARDYLRPSPENLQQRVAQYQAGTAPIQTPAPQTIGQAAQQITQQPTAARGAPKLTFQQVAQIASSPGIDPTRKQLALDLYNRQSKSQEFKFLTGADGHVYRIDPTGRIPAQRAIPQAGKKLDLTAAQKEYFFAVDQGFEGSFTEYKTQLARAGSGVTDTLREQLDKKTGEQWVKFVDAGTTASAMQNDLALMSELVRVAPQGPLTGRLAARFPGFSNAAAALQSVVKRVAPQMRVPGSGATSDIEYQGMLDSLPSLQNRPEANQLIIEMMKAKATIDQERSDIVRRFQQNLVTKNQAVAELAALDKRSIMTPQLDALIKGVQGRGTGGVTSGTTSGGFNWSVN